LDVTITSIPEFQMSLLLFVALAGYLIAHRINQSAVVGIILAGIAVGPVGLASLPIPILLPAWRTLEQLSFYSPLAWNLN